MNTVFSSCVPGFLVKDYEGKPFNILTEDNYEYLPGMSPAGISEKA